MGKQRIVIRPRGTHEYAELVESYYDPVKKSSRSRYIKYLGTVTGYNEDGSPIIRDNSPIIGGGNVVKTTFHEVLSKYVSDPLAMAFFDKLFLNKDVRLERNSKNRIPRTYDFNYSVESKIPSVSYDLFVLRKQFTVCIAHSITSSLDKQSNSNPFINKVNKILKDKDAVVKTETEKEYEAKVGFIFRTLIEVMEGFHKNGRIDLLNCLGSYEQALEVLVKYFVSEITEYDNLPLIVSILLSNGFIIEEGITKYVSLPMK